MDEAQLLAQSAVNVQTSTVGVTAVLTIIFGYFAALYFFIRHTNLPVRLMAFVIYLLGFIYIYLTDYAARQVWRRFIEARENAIAAGLLPDYWAGRDPTDVMWMVDLLSTTLAVSALLVSFYLTVFYRWQISGYK